MSQPRLPSTTRNDDWTASITARTGSMRAERAVFMPTPDVSRDNVAFIMDGSVLHDGFNEITIKGDIFSIARSRRSEREIAA